MVSDVSETKLNEVWGNSVKNFSVLYYWLTLGNNFFHHRFFLMGIRVGVGEGRANLLARGMMSVG